METNPVDLPHSVNAFLTPEMRERLRSAPFVLFGGSIRAGCICPMGVALGLHFSPGILTITEHLLRLGRRPYEQRDEIEGAVMDFVRYVDNADLYGLTVADMLTMLDIQEAS